MQTWRELLFLHWEVSLEALRPLVPASLELDTFDGRAFVGAVPFLMRDIAPGWWPRALGFNFFETNLRTYVHHREGPGVFFFSLEASSWLAVQAARVGWGLPYHHARMEGEHTETGGWYRSERRSDAARFAVEFEIGPAIDPEPTRAHEGLEFFLLERYLLYAERRGRLLRGQVHHSPYPAHEATASHVEEGLFAAAGLPPTSGPPTLVHYSPGVEVEVFAPTPVG